METPNPTPSLAPAPTPTPPPGRPRRGRPPGSGKSPGSSPSPTTKTKPKPERPEPDAQRLATVRKLAKEMGDVVTFAMDLTADIELRKKAAMGMAQRAGIAKFADALVRVEPYAEWVVLGISGVTYLALLAEGYIRKMFGDPAPAPPPQEKLPANGDPRRIPGGSQDDVQA